MKIGNYKILEFKRLAGGFLFPQLLAWLGIVVYLIQAVLFTQIRLPNLDEGFYLYKGLLLTQGTFEPFQPYGPWINKMYLSFMIWGWVQQVLTPGLWGPRLFAVALGCFSLLGLWKLSLRWSNHWLACLVVWVVILNPTLISIYSTARSQILIFFMLTWCLVLSMAVERRAWQIMLSGVLLGLMILTRENMVFIFPFWVFYIFWQHGRKKGFLALVTVIVILVIGHAIYWPEILSLWLKWLPFSVYESTTAGQNMGGSLITSTTSIASRLHSLSLGIRVHLVPVIGSLVVCLFWPRRATWKTPAHHRAAMFLAFLFFTLLIAHSWASLGKDYCVFCFTEYTAFFGSLGVLLFALSFSSLKRKPSQWLLVVIFLIVILSTTAIGYSLFEHIGDVLLKLPVPRMRDGQFLPGWANLREILDNKFHVPYSTARTYTPVVAGMIVGIFLLLIGILVFRYTKKQKPVSLPAFLAFGFLLLGMLLSPILNLPSDEPICRENVIEYYEQTGSLLTHFAPPGTKIYMDGSHITPLLLYLEDPIILLPQLNDAYSFKIGGDPDAVLRNNYWNEQVALSWREESSVFIIEEERMPEWRDYLYTDSFQELSTDQALTCSVDLKIHLFIRK